MSKYECDTIDIIILMRKAIKAVEPLASDFILSATPASLAKPARPCAKSPARPVSIDS